MLNADGRSRLYEFPSRRLRDRFCAQFETMKQQLGLGAWGEGMNEPLTLLVASWNMGENPPAADLSAWLGAAPTATVVAVGLQECMYEARYGYNDCEEDMASTLHSHLGEGYMQLCAVSLNAIRLFVFVRARHVQAVSRLQPSHRAPRLGNIYGNKGGVGAALHFHRTSLCFINVHLAARPERVLDRNADTALILSDLALGQRGLDVSDQFDHSFFFGDLNYRASTRDTAP